MLDGITLLIQLSHVLDKNNRCLRSCAGNSKQRLF